METITITTDVFFSIVGGAVTSITALALALVTWIGKEAIKDLHKLQDDFNELPLNYVRQSAYNRDTDDLKRLIVRVLDKLDKKADKHGL